MSKKTFSHNYDQTVSENAATVSTNHMLVVLSKYVLGIVNAIYIRINSASIKS